MEIAFIPSRILQLFSSGEEVKYQVNILLSNLFLILVLFACYNMISSDTFLPNICLFESICGVECPFCGSTRSIGALFHSDFESSWAYNRVGMILGVYFLLQLPLRIYLLIKEEGPGHVYGKASKIIGRIIVLLFIINWIINLTLLSPNI